MLDLNTDYSYVMDEGKHYPKERFWVDLQPWLKSLGYTLRDRYKPDWMASWLKPGADKDDWPQCEDSIIPDVRGKLVIIFCGLSGMFPCSLAISWTRHEKTGRL